MKKFLSTLFLIIALTLPMAIPAQAAGYSLPLMTGTIGKSKVKMRLDINNSDNTVTGWYYYTARGSKNKIALKGTIETDEETYVTTIKLTETVGGKITGTFNCEFSVGTGTSAYGGDHFYTIYGTFTNSTGKEFDVDISNFN